MTQELRGNIKPVEFIPVEELGDGTKNGSAVDTYESDSQGFHFDSAYIRVGVGDATNVAGDKVQVKVEESDDESNWSVAPGGTEVDVTQETQTYFEIKRSKRHLRVVVTVDEEGGTGAVAVYATGLLTNWSVPMPIIS